MADLSKWMAADVGDLSGLMIPGDKADLASIMGLGIPSGGASGLFPTASDYLTFTPAAGANVQKLTLSLCYLAVGANFGYLFESASGFITHNTDLAFNGQVICRDVGDSGDYLQKCDPAAFFSTSAWVHFCLQIDTTPATPYMKIYKDTVEVTSWTVNVNTMQQNDYLSWLSNTLHSFKPRGYVAEFAVCGGQIYAPTEFATGNVPKDISGLTFGTNGFWLRSVYDGIDSSGNGNDWTVVGSPTQSTEYPN